MKIGILTLPLHTNYGGILQAYALQTVLERMGHQVEVLTKDRKIYLSTYQHLFRAFKRLVKRCLTLKIREPLLWEYEVNKENKIKESNTSVFVTKYIKLSNYKQVNEIVSRGYDTIVVGSDQVWNRYHGSAIDGSVINAYLPFCESKQIKKISYAASFGKDIWEYSEDETLQCKLLLNDFFKVSVREESGVELCKTYYEVDSTCVLDPTLLLEADDYISLLHIDSYKKSDGNLLIYMIDSSMFKNKLIEYVSDVLQLKPFVVNSRVEDRSSEKFSLNEKIQPPVERWLRGFYDAEFIVTDSFHAVLFSIIFKKQFIVIGNKERGITRYKSILSKLGLLDRLIYEHQKLPNMNNLKNIDYKTVDDLLNKQIIQSKSFLKQALA